MHLVAANTSSASRLIISTRVLQIQLGPSFHLAMSAQQLKSFFLGGEAAVIYYTTLTFLVGSFHVVVSLTNLLKPQIIHLILNYSFPPGAAPFLQGFVVTSIHAARLPSVISVGPDDKDIMQRVFKHDADMWHLSTHSEPTRQRSSSRHLAHFP